MAAEQQHLRVKRIPDVGRQVDHTGACPPQANRRAKRIALAPQEGRAYGQRQGQLE